LTLALLLLLSLLVSRLCLALLLLLRLGLCLRLSRGPGWLLLFFARAFLAAAAFLGFSVFPVTLGAR